MAQIYWIDVVNATPRKDFLPKSSSASTLVDVPAILGLDCIEEKS
jgi:hypothetical protein